MRGGRRGLPGWRGWRWPGVTAWLASDRRAGAAGEADTRGTSFTQALLDALGASGPLQERDRRPNLAACLKDLQQNPQLKLQGFCSARRCPALADLVGQRVSRHAAEPRPSWSSRPVTPTR